MEGVRANWRLAVIELLLHFIMGPRIDPCPATTAGTAPCPWHHPVLLDLDLFKNLLLEKNKEANQKIDASLCIDSELQKEGRGAQRPYRALAPGLDPTPEPMAQN